MQLIRWRMHVGDLRMWGVRRLIADERIKLFRSVTHLDLAVVVERVHRRWTWVWHRLSTLAHLVGVQRPEARTKSVPNGVQGGPARSGPVGCHTVWFASELASNPWLTRRSGGRDVIDDLIVSLSL